MTRYAIALGSNLGDRAGYLQQAVAGLAGVGVVVAASGMYETAPVGGPDQGAFLNAVVLLDSELDPRQLLVACQAIERDADRVRQEHWGPRTLDIDIVASDGETVDEEDLRVPHPLAHTRGFVLVPLHEVWPDAPLSGGLTARDSLETVGSAGVARVASDWF